MSGLEPPWEEIDHIYYFLPKLDHLEHEVIPINISCDPGRIENVYVGAECSHAEIQEYTELFK